MRECEQVEKTRQRYAAERARIVSARFGSAGVPPQMSVPGVAPSIVNNMGNNRQQVISASPSQPSIPGFGSNQPVHPHMQFRPQQSIFPMGPRMPLGSLQASSSAPSNVMFNPPGNAQPTLNHPMLRSVSGTGSGLGWNRELDVYFESQYNSILWGLHCKQVWERKYWWAVEVWSQV